MITYRPCIPRILPFPFLPLAKLPACGATYLVSISMSSLSQGSRDGRDRTLRLDFWVRPRSTFSLFLFIWPISGARSTLFVTARLSIPLPSPESAVSEKVLLH